MTGWDNGRTSAWSPVGNYLWYLAFRPRPPPLTSGINVRVCFMLQRKSAAFLIDVPKKNDWPARAQEKKRLGQFIVFSLIVCQHAGHCQQWFPWFQLWLVVKTRKVYTVVLAHRAGTQEHVHEAQGCERAGTPRPEGCCPRCQQPQAQVGGQGVAHCPRTLSSPLAHAETGLSLSQTHLIFFSQLVWGQKRVLFHFLDSRVQKGIITRLNSSVLMTPMECYKVKAPMIS